jgi:hypothetical protein
MKLLPDWIKNYRIDIYKDLVFWPIALLWLIGNNIEWYYTNDAIWVNQGFIFLMCILIFIKTISTKFNNWLNTPLNKNERYKYKRKKS